jgi:hypothetical protein
MEARARRRGMRRPATTRTHSVQDWLDSIFNLAELLSLTEDELCQLEELDGDIALTAAWWRRRRARERDRCAKVRRHE